MKTAYVLGIAALLFVMMFSSGCTQEQKTPVLTPTPTPQVALAAISAPVALPHPNALTLNMPAPFGTGDMAGTATVTKYYLKNRYDWTSPTWRSTREQATYALSNDVQTGYNREKPAEGNLFVIVFFRVANTGTKAVYAPSPQQIVLAGDDTTYGYHPVSDSGVIIDGVTGTQYDYLLGKGGTGGYVQPGTSNTVEGYLIYEIPANLSPDRIVVLANLDYQTRAEWKLA